MPRHFSFTEIWVSHPISFTYPGKKIASHCTCWGSLVASVGGLLANYLGGNWGNAAFIVSIGGLITAIGGLIASIGNQVVAVLKIYSDQEKSEREAKLARHDMANHLQEAKLRIEELKAVLAENQARIDDQHFLIMNLSQMSRSNRTEIKALELGQAENHQKIDDINRVGSESVEVLAVAASGTKELVAGAVVPKVEEANTRLEDLRSLIEIQHREIESLKVAFANANIAIPLQTAEGH